MLRILFAHPAQRNSGVARDDRIEKRHPNRKAEGLCRNSEAKVGEEEFIRFLKKHQIEYDRKYLFG